MYKRARLLTTGGSLGTSPFNSTYKEKFVAGSLVLFCGTGFRVTLGSCQTDEVLQHTLHFIVG